MSNVRELLMRKARQYRENLERDPKHSKGPWTAHTDVAEPVIVALGESYEPQVALISNIDGQTNYNAQLIAAAPELFEQLEIAIEYFKNNGGNESYTFLSDMENIINKARR